MPGCSAYSACAFAYRSLPSIQFSRSAIQRVAQFADERSGAIKLRLDKGGITVSSSSAETGESEDQIEASTRRIPS
jgi:DNA polymerase III sliding clamp (beta) subunit (PCNA family)